MNQLQNLRSYTALSNICVLLTGLLGLTVILGWFLNLGALIQIHPEYVPMQFNTALGFFVAALAAGNWSAQLQSLKLVFASIIGLIGGLTLIQYGLDVSFGIDELFFDHYLDVKTSHPGRMAPNTALCFLLIAVSILIAYTKQTGQRQLIFSTTLIVCTLALALVAAIGYLSDIEQTYGWGLYTQMAMHTSIGFVLLCVGLLIQKLMSYEQRVPTYVLSVQLGFLLFVMSLVLWQATASRENEQVKQQIASDFEYFTTELQEQLTAYQDATARFNNVLQLVPEELYDALMETLTETMSGYNALLAVAMGSSNGEIVWRFPASVSQELLKSSFDPEPVQGNVTKSMASFGHVQFAPGIGKVAALYRLPESQEPQTKNQLINVALIDITALVTPIASKMEERGLELNIIDKNSSVALYGEISESAHLHRQTFRLDLLHQQWEVNVHPSSITDYDQNYALPSIVLFAGVLLTLLISALAHSLTVYRRTNYMLQ